MRESNKSARLLSYLSIAGGILVTAGVGLDIAQSLGHVTPIIDLYFDRYQNIANVTSLAVQSYVHFRSIIIQMKANDNIMSNDLNYCSDSEYKQLEEEGRELFFNSVTITSLNLYNYSILGYFINYQSSLILYIFLLFAITGIMILWRNQPKTKLA